MKNKLFKISSLAIILSLVFSISVFAESTTRQYVYDSAYYLDDTQYAELNALAAETSEKYGCAVHFIITDDPSINYNNIQMYSEDLYLESPVLGYGEGKDGVMLVLGTYDRCYWLLAYGEKGNFAFTDYAKDWMSNRFVEYFSYDDWYGGFREYIECCDYILSEAATGSPVDIYYNDMGVEAYGIALIAGIIIAAATCGIFKKQMQTARIATTAASYVDRNEAQITNRYNRLVHTSVSRTEIQSSSSSSGSSSRGGTSVNSRGFSGKGGRF